MNPLLERIRLRYCSHRNTPVFMWGAYLPACGGELVTPHQRLRKYVEFRQKENKFNLSKLFERVKDREFCGGGLWLVFINHGKARPYDKSVAWRSSLGLWRLMNALSCAELDKERLEVLQCATARALDQGYAKGRVLRSRRGILSELPLGDYRNHYNWIFAELIVAAGPEPEGYNPSRPDITMDVIGEQMVEASQPKQRTSVPEFEDSFEI